HPLARSALYGDASADERRAAHRALAGALPDRDADRRAWHPALATVGPDDAASSALEHAAARAFQRSPYAVATSAFERPAGLAVERAVVMLAEATNMSFYAGDARAMLRSAERAVELAPQADGRAAIFAGLAVGMAFVLAGAGEEGAQSIRRAVQQLEASDEL